METNIPADVLALARAQNEAYLIAFRAGYEAGFKAATTQALALMNAPIADSHLKVVK